MIGGALLLNLRRTSSLQKKKGSIYCRPRIDMIKKEILKKFRRLLVKEILEVVRDVYLIFNSILLCYCLMLF
jgi:hypothetical protein